MYKITKDNYLKIVLKNCIRVNVLSYVTKLLFGFRTVNEWKSGLKGTIGNQKVISIKYHPLL